MKTRLLVCAFIAALLPGTVAAQTAPGKTAELLQIIADQLTGGGHADITIGALGTDVPKVPLPSAEIIGSIAGKPAGTAGSLVGSRYEIYYAATDEAIKTYAKTLAAAGWKPQSFLGQGGFVSNDSTDAAVYCRADAPAITTAAGGKDQRYLQVAIMSGRAAATMCSIGNMMSMMKAVAPSMDAPLPELHAPAGAQMQAALPAASLGRASALITSSSEAKTLLDAFAAQFVSAGWTAGPTASGAGIASQTFDRTDDQKQEWECVLTIYPVNGKPGTYLASIQPTNLTATK
jgi:hypothetical protein